MLLHVCRLPAQGVGPSSWQLWYHYSAYRISVGLHHCVQVPPFKKTLTDAMPYIDYLFGNETEAAAFAESEGWKDMGVPDIAQAVSPALQLLHCAQAFLHVVTFWHEA